MGFVATALTRTNISCPVGESGLLTCTSLSADKSPTALYSVTAKAFIVVSCVLFALLVRDALSFVRRCRRWFAMIVLIVDAAWRELDPDFGYSI